MAARTVPSAIGHPTVTGAERQQERRLPLRLLPLSLALWLLLLSFAYTDLKIQTRATQLLTYFAAFAVFCLAVGVVWRLGHGASRRVVWFILLVGIGYRLTLAPMRPITTSDVYRYLWEGRLVNQGHNPFAERPDAPAPRRPCMTGCGSARRFQIRPRRLSRPPPSTSSRSPTASRPTASSPSSSSSRSSTSARCYCCPAC